MVVIDLRLGEYELFNLGPANRKMRRAAVAWTWRRLTDHGWEVDRELVRQTYHGDSQ